jgi:hypothetical protein
VGKTAAELREEIEIQRAEVGKDLDAIGDRVSPGRIMERKTESVKEKFRGVKDSVMGTAEDANDTLHDGAGTVADVASGTRDSAVDLAQSARDNVAAVPGKVRTTTQGNPLAVGLVAFGFGLIAASLIPPSRKEQELGQQLQPQLEDAARRASEAGRGLVDELKPEVSKAVGQVKDQATEAAQRLGDQAKQGAQSTAETAKEAAHS